MHFYVCVQGEDGEDIVAKLRSGAAAVNAVASMQGRGMGHLRRSQYRLTPGTVKYAAFHVLSLEGEKGLNIAQVADRIQVQIRTLTRILLVSLIYRYCSCYLVLNVHNCRHLIGHLSLKP